MTEDPKALAARLLSCLDLTDLSESCDAEDVIALCESASTEYGPVAAICIWPEFVRIARERLNDMKSKVKLATVANFPSGGGHDLHVVTEVEEALAAGANEIDVVLPYNALIHGNVNLVGKVLRHVKDLCKKRPMKVILESGALKTPELIQQASNLAIACGADFLKTSTGKTEIGATPEAAGVMLESIRRADRKVGLKISGGVRTLQDAATYVSLAEMAMGPEFICPERFRIGASSLLDALLAELDAKPAPTHPNRGSY